MNRLLYFVLIMCSATRLSSCNNFLIKDYLRTKQLTTLLFISCSNETLPIERLRTVHGVWINVWDITDDEPMLNDFNYNKFFGRYSHSHGVVVNLECNKINLLLIQLSKRILFHNERFWLMFTKDLEKSAAVLRPQNIKVDAEIILAVPGDLNRDGSYNIYEVLKVASTRGGETHFNITQLGNWNKSGGFNLPGKQTKIERRRDLRGITLSAVISLASIPNGTTYLKHLQSEELTHLDSMNRMMYRLCNVMMDIYNFKIHIRLSNTWGASDSTGRWNGAIGLINRSEVDLCITSVRLSNERYGAFEYTTHSYHNQLQFTFLHPKAFITANVYLQPFKSMVWYAMVGLCMLCVFIVRCTTLLEKQSTRCNGTHADQIDDSYSNSVMMVLAFMFQQSMNYVDRSAHQIEVTGRFARLEIASVGSLLTDPPKNIKTIRQLVYSPFKFRVDVVPYMRDVFKRTTENPDVVQLYKKVMTRPEHVLVPLRTGVHLMKQGGVVFITDASYANIYMQNVLTDSEKCELQAINLIDKLSTGMPVPNKSPLKEMIRVRITETGILSYYNKVWSGTHVKQKCENSGPVFSAVDITHFSSAIFMLIVGIVSSLSLLIFEQILHYFLKRRMLNCRK